VGTARHHVLKRGERVQQDLAISASMTMRLLSTVYGDVAARHLGAVQPAMADTPFESLLNDCLPSVKG
jgi:hypothetical protein